MSQVEVSQSQQSHRRREAVDCFNCSASRRRCDRTRHRCNTCNKGSEICQGYPRELQWLAGVTSRGKRKGQSISIKASNREWESTTPTNYAFIFKQARSPRRRNQGTKSSTGASPRTVTSPGCLAAADGSPSVCAEASPTVVADVDSAFSSTDIRDLDHVANPFECVDSMGSIFDPSFSQNQTLSETDGTDLLLPLSSEVSWLDQPVPAATVSHNAQPQLFPLTPSVPDSGPSDLLTLCELFSLQPKMSCSNDYPR